MRFKYLLVTATMLFFSVALFASDTNQVGDSTIVTDNNDKHLFILTGTGNMKGVKPEKSFTPIIEKEFGKENIIIVQDTSKAKPMSTWYKDWKDPAGNTPAEGTGHMYRRVLKKVLSEIEGHKLKSVTLLWMQGESDAKFKYGDVYKASLKGMLEDLKKDLHITNLHFVVGRLSDHDGNKSHTPEDWEKIRKAQVEIAEETPLGAWVDTDDLNDGILNDDGKQVNDHPRYTIEGYVTFGKRLAEKAVDLIKKNP